MSIENDLTMKRKSLFWLILFLGVNVSVFAQKKTILEGFIKYGNTQQITLFTIENGKLKECETAMVKQDRSYNFTFVPERPGFYALGDKQKNFPIYMKGGEKIQLNLYKDGVVFMGKNTKENKALYQWEKYLNDMRAMSGKEITYKEFFPWLTKFVTKIDSLKGVLTSGNRVFDKLLHRKMDYDVDYYAIMFLMSPRSLQPQRSDWPAFYDTILSDEKFATDELLSLPGGANILMTYYNFTYRIDAPKKGEEAFHNASLRGEVLLYVFSIRAKYYSEYEDFIKENGNILTENQKERAKIIAAKLYPSLVGKKGNFTYPDVNGKEVSLSDFEGKVVVVDVWTTTCGACFAQYVYLTKLVEELQGKDVVFVGISLDREKDKQKWMNVVKEKYLEGIQLYASDQSQFAKDYNITGVPRFIVFDKKGCVVKEEAPRPSDPLLKEIIETELKK